MPTPASPGTNEFRCEACGRHFNSEGELRSRAAECVAAKRSGFGGQKTGEGKREEGADRDWVGTP